MTSLLTPISHLFLEDSSANRILENSDELEARERTCNLRLKNTTHYHIDFDLNLEITQQQQEFLAKEVAPREYIKTLTFQMSRDCVESSLIDGQYQVSSRPLTEHEQLNNISKSLKTIRDLVGSDRNIGFENNNYYPTGAYDICTSENFLVKVLENTGMHLLLDYAHAKVTSINRSIDFGSYIQALLNSNTCQQIHFCEHTVYNSPVKDKAKAIDAHELPSVQTTTEVLEIAKSYKVPYLTVEYYKDAYILAEFLGKLSSQLNE